MIPGGSNVTIVHSAQTGTWKAAWFSFAPSLFAAGVGVEHAIRETGEPHLHGSTLMLIAGGLAGFLTSVTLIRIVTGICNMVFVRWTAVALLLTLMYLGSFLPAIPVVAAMFFVMVGGIWVETRYSPGHLADTA
jgi:hypothetical protein